MIRKNFFLTEAQDEWLGELAENSELFEAELVRRIFDYVIERQEITDEVMYRRKKNASKSKN
jgi:hypothetical protein